MKYINQIRIKYFRSIYNVVFDNISDTLTVFTGGNDVGKSNVLRALNLFFNDETDVDEEIIFERDFSKIRKKEIKETVKTRQLISIAIQINTPQGYNSLPKTFWVTRTYDRYDDSSDYIFEKDITADKKKLASARRLINSFEYIYIPAIKDKETFQQILQRLKSNLPPLGQKELTLFNKKLDEYGDELKEDFTKKLGLLPALSLPSTAKELFASLDFSVSDTTISTSLSQRGDGVRCRFIPSIMNYIAKNSKTRQIWGIEEPENSLEFAKAWELNLTLENEYSQNAQIFVTSHSPAFVATIEKKSRKIVYLLNKEDNNKVSIEKIDRNLLQDTQKLKLAKKLGYISLQKDLADCLNAKIKEAEQRKEEFIKLSETIKNTQKSFILCVEGESDKILLETAWKKLYPSIPMPFYIHICYADTQVKSLIERIDLNSFQGKTFIGLFDFDSAYNQWNGVASKWQKKQTDEKQCLLNKKDNLPIYAMLLPIPDFRVNYASSELKGNSALSIELLFKDDVIADKTTEQKCLGGGCIRKFNNSQKINFANSSSDLSAIEFTEFKKIFQTIQNIQNGMYN